MNKFMSVVAIVISIVAIVLVLVGGNQPVKGELGASGSRYPNGISADGTSPVAGQVRGATVTATGALSAGTVSVTGIASMATTSMTSLCLPSGSAGVYAKITFSGATPSYATSTTCQ